MKNRKGLIITTMIIFIVGFIGVGIWVWNDFLKKGNPPLLGDKGTAEKTKNNSTAPGTDDFPLQKGSKGENVKELQRRLNKLIEYYFFGKKFRYNGVIKRKISEDGMFGDVTQAAVNWHFGHYKPLVTKNELESLN